MPLPKAPTAAKAGARAGVHTVNGKVVSKRSKTGRSECSQAMSAWKTSGMTADIAKTLGRCRAAAAQLKGATAHRNAGNELKAQALEHRAQGEHVGVRARLERAKQLVAQRRERTAQPAAAEHAATVTTAPRDRSPEAARQRIAERIQRAQQTAAERPHDERAKRTVERFRGRDLQAGGIARAKAEGGPGYFAKLRERRAAAETTRPSLAEQVAAKRAAKGSAKERLAALAKRAEGQHERVRSQRREADVQIARGQSAGQSREWIDAQTRAQQRLVRREIAHTDRAIKLKRAAEGEAKRVMSPRVAKILGKLAEVRENQWSRSHAEIVARDRIGRAINLRDRANRMREWEPNSEKAHYAGVAAKEAHLEAQPHLKALHGRNGTKPPRPKTSGMSFPEPPLHEGLTARTRQQLVQRSKAAANTAGAKPIIERIHQLRAGVIPGHEFARIDQTPKKNHNPAHHTAMIAKHHAELDTLRGRLRELGVPEPPLSLRDQAEAHRLRTGNADRVRRENLASQARKRLEAARARRNPSKFAERPANAGPRPVVSVPSSLAALTALRAKAHGMHPAHVEAEVAKLGERHTGHELRQIARRFVGEHATTGSKEQMLAAIAGKVHGRASAASPAAAPAHAGASAGAVDLGGYSRAQIARRLPPVAGGRSDDPAEMIARAQEGLQRRKGLAEKVKGVRAQNEQLRAESAAGRERAQRLAAKRSRTAGKLVEARSELHEARRDPSTHTEHAPGHTGMLKTDLVHFDPNRFQYKLAHAAETGSVGSLEGVKAWNHDLAGVMQVWKDPSNGKTYVVNGHNRLDKAKKLGVGEVNVRFINATDASHARQIGALTNIAEGNGTSTDAAKFFRESGLGPEHIEAHGVSLRGKVAHEGLGLSRLSDKHFRRVIDGDLAPARGAVIGHAGLSESQQDALFTMLDKRSRSQPVTDRALRETLESVKAAPTKTEKKSDLFGEDEHETSLALHRGDVAAHVKERLGNDKKLFGVVSKSKHAARLEEAGNKIDAETSGKISGEAATTLAAFDQLKNRSGPIAHILNHAAERLHGGEKRQKVHEETYHAIRKAMPDALDNVFG